MRTGTLACFSVLLASRVCAAPVATTVTHCNKPDGNFPAFLSRFTKDVDFQRARIIFPLVSRAGNGVTDPATIELWTMKDVKALTDPLIYSSAGRRAEGLIQSIAMMPGNRYAEVVQDQREADVIMLRYRFGNFSGCWFLEEVDDLGE
jgi:hypothetical protein